MVRIKLRRLGSLLLSGVMLSVVGAMARAEADSPSTEDTAATVATVARSMLVDEPPVVHPCEDGQWVPRLAAEPAERPPVPANGTSFYTVRVSSNDQCEHLWRPGNLVSFATTGSAQLSAYEVVIGQDDWVEVTMTDTVVETVTVNAKLIDPARGETLGYAAPVEARFEKPSDKTATLYLSRDSLSISRDPNGDPPAQTPASLKVLIVDADGNLVPDQRVEFEAGWPLVLSDTSVAAEKGRAETWMTLDPSQSFSGLAYIRAYSDGLEVEGSPAAVRVEIDVEPAMTLTVVPTVGDPVHADGIDSWTATVKLASWLGVGAVDLQVVESDGPSLDSVMITPVDGQPQGTYVAQLRSRTPGTLTVQASFNDITATSPPISFAAASATTATLSLSGTDVLWANNPCGGPGTTRTQTATVTVLDAHGDPLPGQLIDFEADPALDLDAWQVGTDSQGRASVTISPGNYGPYQSGIAEGRAHLGGAAVTGSPARLNYSSIISSPPAPAWPRLSVTATNGGPVWADGSTAYTAQVSMIDACGRAEPGATVAFTVTGSAQLSQVTAVIGEDGLAAVTVVDTVPEGVVVSASMPPGSSYERVEGSPVEVWFHEPPSPDQLNAAIVLDPALEVLADGVDAWRATILATDQQGGPVAGLAERFGFQVAVPRCLTRTTARCSDYGGDARALAWRVTDNQDGTYEVGFTSTVPGWYIVWAHVLDESGAMGGELVNSPLDLVFAPVPTTSAPTDAPTDELVTGSPTGTPTAPASAPDPTAPASAPDPTAPASVPDSTPTPTPAPVVGSPSVPTGGTVQPSQALLPIVGCLIGGMALLLRGPANGRRRIE